MMKTHVEQDSDGQMLSDFDDLDNALSSFDGIYLEGGADPTLEDDNCTDGACKI